MLPLRVSKPEWFSRGGTEGFVATHRPDGDTEETTIVVFRGTQIEWVPLTWRDVVLFRVGTKIRAALSDVFTDLGIRRVRWRDDMTVHNGGSQALGEVSLKIHHLIGEHRNSRIHIIGHSLGGLLAQLEAGRLIATAQNFEVSVTTFGCPGVGNAAFARYVEDGCKQNDNYVYCSDIVPRLLCRPFGYYVPGHRRYVNRNGKRRFRSTLLGRLADRTIERLTNWCKKIIDQDISHHSMKKLDGLI